MTRNRKIALYLLLFVAVEAFQIAFVDRDIATAMYSFGTQHVHFLAVMNVFTDLGLSKWYLWPSGLGLVCCVIMLRFGRLSHDMRVKVAALGNRLFIFFATLALTGIAVDIVKWLIGRARPVLFLREGFYGFQPFTPGFEWKSLPSGHSATVFAIAAIMVSFHPRWRKPCLIFGTAIALSRIVVDMHFLSDIIAGSLFGYIVASWIVACLNHNGMHHLKESIFPIDAKTPAS